MIPEVSHVSAWYFMLPPEEDEDIFGVAHLNNQRSQTLQERISSQRHVLDVFSAGSDVHLYRDNGTGF